MSKKSVPTIFFAKVWAFAGSNFAVKRLISDRWACASRFCRKLNSSCMTTARTLPSVNCLFWTSLSGRAYRQVCFQVEDRPRHDGRAWRRKHLPSVKSAAAPLQQHPGSSISILSHARRASSDRLSFSSWASQKKSKERLESGQFRIDDSPWQDCVQFFF